MKSFFSCLIEQYNLSESLESVIKNNPDIPESSIRKYHADALDPNNKSDRALNFVLKLDRGFQISPERANELKPHMIAVSRGNLFSKLKNVHTIHDLHDLTDQHLDDIYTRKEKIDRESPVVFENDHIKVTQHLSHDSAIKAARLHPENPVYGQCSEPGKAQWCVSADNKDGFKDYNRYTSHGLYPLYTILNKNTKRVHALVADKSKNIKNFELRDEMDNENHRTLGDINNFINDHPGIKNTAVGDYLYKISPKSEKINNYLPKNATHEEINHAIDSNDLDLRNAALYHPNVTKENINRALEKGDEDTKISALNHPNVTKENINRALENDMSINVKKAAIRSKNVNAENINRALENDMSFGIKMIAINHQNATKENLRKGLKDADADVRSTAQIRLNNDDYKE